MTLRCRKGDMAIVIRSFSGNEGKICDVYEFLGKGECGGISYENIWLLSYSGQTHNPINGHRWGCPDNWLLPIRPGDLQEQDETEKELTA